MNYLKSFNETLKPFDQAKAIKEFCQGYLAYLLDKSYFNIEVYPSSNKPYNEVSYEIELRDNPDGNTFSGDQIFNWGDVKDYFIPFLTFLGKEYNIDGIVIFQYIPKYGPQSQSIRGLKNLDDSVKMKNIKVLVTLKKPSIIKKIKSFFKKESVESVMSNLINKVDKVMNELQELWDQHLIYLQDGGFNYNIDIDEHNGLSKGDLVINIDKNNLESQFYWNDIKDRFIPFLLMLDKDFNVGTIDFYGKDAEFTISNLCSETFVYERHTVNTYLAYLIDEGFETDINLDGNENSKSVDLYIYKLYTKRISEIDQYGDEDILDNFKWDDIKDQFIPFISSFSKEYSFEKLKISSYYGSECRTFRKGGSLENLLSDNFEIEEELREIVICNIRRL